MSDATVSPGLGEGVETMVCSCLTWLSSHKQQTKGHPEGRTLWLSMAASGETAAATPAGGGVGKQAAVGKPVGEMGGMQLP